MMWIVLSDVAATEMTGMSWLVFSLVGGFVWGGFALLLLRAIRREESKK